MTEERKQRLVLTAKMDKQTRDAVTREPTLDDALRKNPYDQGTNQHHMWFNLLRAKWAVVHDNGVLLSKRS
jgi:hypothetical protein